MPPEDLAINFSHVLHEPPDHPTVQAAVRAAGKRLHVSAHPDIILDSTFNDPPDVWLTASIGLPDRLPELLEVDKAAIIQIDNGNQPTRECHFFGAPARLTLPESTATVGVAAVVIRPGGRSLQLIIRGPFTMPHDESQVLRELESLIQSHADQWRPSNRLWDQGFRHTGFS